MKILTIFKPDNVVGVDGVFYEIDLTGIASPFRALTWYEDEGVGDVEWMEGRNRFPNTKIYSIEEYQQYLDLWNQKHQEMTGGV